MRWCAFQHNTLQRMPLRRTILFVARRNSGLASLEPRMCKGSSDSSFFTSQVPFRRSVGHWGALPFPAVNVFGFFAAEGKNQPHASSVNQLIESYRNVLRQRSSATLATLRLRTSSTSCSAIDLRVHSCKRLASGQ